MLSPADQSDTDQDYLRYSLDFLNHLKNIEDLRNKIFDKKIINMRFKTNELFNSLVSTAMINHVRIVIAIYQ